MTLPAITHWIPTDVVETYWPREHCDKCHQPFTESRGRTADVSIFQRSYLSTVEPHATLPSEAKDKLEEKYDTNSCLADRLGSRKCNEYGKDAYQYRHDDSPIEEDTAAANALDRKI